MAELHRTLHYQHASFLIPNQGQTLQQLLTQALASNPLAEDRERPMGQQRFQVLNTTYAGGTALCGVVHQWIHGQNQLAVDRVAGAPVWAVQEVAPPQATGQPDFLPHTLYFGVIGDHLVLLQSQGMMAAELGHYFTWLIRDKSRLVPATQQIDMNLASAATLRARGVDAAKAIRIRRPIADLVNVPADPNDLRTKAHVEKVVNEARADAITSVLNVLDIPIPQAILGGDDARDLELYLEIRRPYGRDILGNPAMNSIARLVAQQVDDNYVVELQTGGELKGSQLKLTRPITIQAQGTHPAPMAVFNHIDDYLRHLIATRAV